MIFVIELELSCEKRLILTVTCIASIYVTDPDQLVLTEALRSSCTFFFTESSGGSRISGKGIHIYTGVGARFAQC